MPANFATISVNVRVIIDDNIAVGDIVTLKTYSPEMVVNSIFTTDSGDVKAWCMYFNSGTFNEKCFNIKTLKLVNK